MYNLIFVDDESRVLNAVRDMLPWDEMNVRVIGWCDNAISALELMINEHTDILVTDIKMPIMDGLELISRAKEMYPSIECLVLSGYEEFELARAAIERGVRGYLLKPCNKEALETSIKSCVSMIEREQVATSYRFEQRQKQIERLYDELLNLKLNHTDADADQVQQIAVRYQDYTLLREASIMAAIQHEQSVQNLHPIVKKLAQISHSDELIQCTVQILREISKHTDIADPVVAKMVQYVYDHYDITSLTIQDVADHEIHLTARYIGRRFLKEMNMKFSDFLLQVRMEKAIEFLHDSDYSNADEIANKIGLGNNVQYFYRLFRQYTGMALKEYREKMIKGETLR